jgi:hypothetical protein
VEHKDDIIAEKEKVRDDFRDEEMVQIFTKLVKSVSSSLNDSVKIDGLPRARSEHEAEAMADVRGYVDEDDVRAALVKAMPEFFKGYFEITKY